MSEIIRKDISEEWAHSGIIKAGDYCFLNYCVGNIEGTVEEDGATWHVFSFYMLESRFSEKSHADSYHKREKQEKSFRFTLVYRFVL